MKRLGTLLQSIDHKGYPAYKSLRGSYQFGNYQLNIDHVQGDPFAAPSRVSVKILGARAGFPSTFYEKKHRRIALEDHILRLFHKEIEKYNFKASGSGKSGLIAVCACGQEVLERSACHVNEKNGDVEVHFAVGFPANGRSINARELEKILFQFLPKCVEETCLYQNVDAGRLKIAVELADDQAFIRSQMKKEGIVAFVANGSILPRESGVSQRPMKGAIPFQSPKSMEVTWKLPHRGEVTGMAIREGITLIVGGGYHGKSTLLQALQWAVYSHIPGDGREYVVTDDTAFKIRSEDGRSICNTDISLFIRNLPNSKDTASFSTLDASGSTSQAANVVEAMEAGANLLLLDEDTSAANFMIRDELMEMVVAEGKEPIVPFIRRVRGLYLEAGISTILVAGSCGAFFHVADTIIQMDEYEPYEITEQAKKAADRFPLNFDCEAKMDWTKKERTISFSKKRGRDDRGSKIKTMGRDGFMINKENVDLRYLEQIADGVQMTGIAKILDYLQEQYAGKEVSVDKIADEVMKSLEQEGIYATLKGSGGTDLAVPRKCEICGCINRYVKGKNENAKNIEKIYQ